MGDPAGAVSIGIDIGTTSVKAVAATADGTIVSRTRIAHELRAPDADTFEHDARAAWVDGVLAAWEEVASGHEVGAAMVSAMVPSLCGVDDTGTPVTAGVLYGDARGRTDHDATAGMGESLGFARALRHEPGVAALWPAQAVANHALCGVGAIDTSTAMTMTPLFTGTGWDAHHLGDLDLTDEQLPRFVVGGSVIGTRDGAAIGCGTIDALAEQDVAAATAPGDVVVICGTTLIPWALTTEWIEIDGLWTIPYSIPGVIAVGGASNAGGLFIDSVRRFTGDPAPAEVLDVTPDGRPLWLPYIRGERTPFHDPTRRAALLEVDRTHGPAAVMAAAYDAAAMVVRHHLDLARGSLEAAGTPPTRIVAAGGGTRSPAWMQSLADVTGLPVDVSAHPEGAALGAARGARVAAGLPVEGDWRAVGHRVEPRPTHREGSDDRYIRFREAIDR